MQRSYRLQASPHHTDVQDHSMCKAKSDAHISYAFHVKLHLRPTWNSTCHQQPTRQLKVSPRPLPRNTRHYGIIACRIHPIVFTRSPLTTLHIAGRTIRYQHAEPYFTPNQRVWSVVHSAVQPHYATPTQPSQPLYRQSVASRAPQHTASRLCHARPK